MSLRPARWSAGPYSVAAADRVSAELGLSPVTAAILSRRGYDTPEAARGFLAAETRHEALSFDGMRSACELILDHVRRRSRIVVHGDYDVDGVCATAVLLRALRRLGAAPAWHLPSRFDDGYGLSGGTIDRLAAQGTELLVTADCAITAVGEVADARARGIDVVVTDHHRPGERLPACPVVHPALGYPFEGLCAAGVAHKVAEALYGLAGEDPALAEEDLDLVALATVADLVPLRDENRRLAHAGLKALASTTKPGLRALMAVAGLDPGALDARAAAFVLAPRLNAAGRLQRADAALELLMTEDERRAAEIADELDLLNRERRDAETRILFAAEAARAPQAHEPAYVVAGEGWHPGVVGIVASRLVERHHRPCVVIALDGDGGRGSGRTIPAYDLHAGLEACREHLRRFGGHRSAAGLELDAARVEPFRRAFARHAASMLTPDDLRPLERVDAVAGGEALGPALAEELRLLEPFGQGNPAPVLLVSAARVAGASPMGEERQHARFKLSSGGRPAVAVAFRTTAASLSAAADDPQDAAVRLELNEWNGAVEARLVLRSLCPTEAGPCDVLGEDAPFWGTLEAELERDPAPFCGEAAGPARALRDRRGAAFAALVGDLLSSGEGVLVVCADVARRRVGLDSVIGGLARGARLGLVSWEALAAEPSLAEPFEHIVALDPPPAAAGEGLIAGAPGPPEAFAYLAWGPGEVEFAAAVARATLGLRESLAEVYRGLRAGGTLAGEPLRALLQGTGSHPRSAALCGRLVRVLVELGHVSYEGGKRSCRFLEAGRAPLETSQAYRAYRARLAEAERYLAGLRTALAA